MPSAANQVRIIGGIHRGRRLRFVPVLGLRPTPDRVRETLFNWLSADIVGARCLDLYAGSGALGMESLSRGAAYLMAVERNRAAAQRLRENLSLLDAGTFDVIQADVLRVLKQCPDQPFDIVFADPPFAGDLLGETCRRLVEAGWLTPDGRVYIEQDAHRAWPELPAGWAVHREGRAGQSAHRLLRCSKLD